MTAERVRQIVARSATFVSLRVLTGGLSVLASLLLYRLLGPGEAGRFQFVLATGMTLGVVSGLGFHDTLARFGPELSGRAARGLLRAALRRSLPLGLAAGGLLFGLGRLVGWPQDASRAGPALPAFISIYALYTCALGLLRGQGRLGALNGLDLGWNFGAKAIAVLVALSIPAFAPVFAAYTLVDLLVAGIALWLLRGALREPASALDGPMRRFAGLALLADVVRILCATVDIYVIRGLLGPEATGLFTAGARLTMIVEQLVLTPMGVPLLYYFSQPGSAELRRSLVENGTRLLGGVMGAGALALAAAAGPLVRFLLGPEYQGSVAVARIYTGHAVAASLLVLLVPLYNSRNRPEFASIQAVVILGLSLALDLALVPRLGITGAAIAGVAATSVTALTFAGLARSRFQVDLRGGVARVLGLYLGCSALLAAGLVVPSLLAYAAGLWALRIVRRGDLELLRRRRPGAEPAPDPGRP